MTDFDDARDKEIRQLEESATVLQRHLTELEERIVTLQTIADLAEDDADRHLRNTQNVAKKLRQAHSRIDELTMLNEETKAHLLVAEHELARRDGYIASARIAMRAIINACQSAGAYHVPDTILAKARRVLAMKSYEAIPPECSECGEKLTEAVTCQECGKDTRGNYVNCVACLKIHSLLHRPL